jgi:hypothetical protein
MVLTAAYWLLLTLRDRIPRPHPLASAEVATIRPHLLKVAGRVIETASRIRIAFAAACPQAVLFRGRARSFLPAGPGHAATSGCAPAPDTQISPPTPRHSPPPWRIGRTSYQPSG